MLLPRFLFAVLFALILSTTWVRASVEESKSSETSKAAEALKIDRIEIVVSVADQKLALLANGEVVHTYSISTSRFGIGDDYGTYRTPLGRLKISEKIGDGLASGSVIRHRTATGEVLAPNAPGRDPIVSRILWLDGLEAGNRNAFGRCVYIHGTPDEKHLGRPASYGCIRMRSTDVIELYSAAPVGAEVSILKGRLPYSGGSLLELVASAALPAIRALKF